MIHLIIKDIVTQAKYLMLIVVLFMVFSFVGGFGNFYLGVGTMMLAMRLAWLEEKNNALLFLRTMPLKPSMIVISKYLSVLLLAVVFTLIGFSKMFFFQEIELEQIVGFMTIMSTMLLFSGFFLVFYFKMGYMKAATYFRFILLSLFVLTFVGATTIDKLKPIANQFLQNVMFNWGYLVIAGVLVVAVYLALSFIAVQIFSRKEIYSTV